jgi:hypothetical protein
MILGAIAADQFSHSPVTASTVTSSKIATAVTTVTTAAIPTAAREASACSHSSHRRIKNPAVANVNPNFCSRA